MKVPPPPKGLYASERRRYEHNRDVLKRWSETSAAFAVPPKVAARYCREVVGFYEGGAVEDVGGVLRDFMQDEAESGGSAGVAEQKKFNVKKGMLEVGGTAIEVEDPELIAYIQEYLGAQAGRKRLLDWLRRNVGRK